MSFAERLDALIVSRGLTDTQVAAYAEVSQPTINQWKRGRQWPRLNTFQRFIEGMHLSGSVVLWLLEHPEGEFQPPHHGGGRVKEIKR